MYDSLSRIPGYVWMVAVTIIGIIIVGALVVNKNQQVLNNIQFPIELTEFFDYRCSHCADLYPALEEARSKYGEQIAITFRHLPILGEASVQMAYGAEAAKKQGKFQEFHDAAFGIFRQILEGQGDASTYTPEAVATAIELDMEKFATDIASAEVKAVVEADRAEAGRYGFASTPSMLIEGQNLEYAAIDSDGNVTYQPLFDAIDKYIAQAEANTK